jgi:hypothetical protein
VLWVTFAVSLASAQVGAVDPAKPSPGNLSEELFYSSAAASGRWFCDGVLVPRLSDRFDGRFGGRITALMKAHDAKYGRDADFKVTAACIFPDQSYNQDKAMDEFEPKLHDLEQKYGG